MCETTRLPLLLLCHPDLPPPGLPAPPHCRPVKSWLLGPLGAGRGGGSWVLFLGGATEFQGGLGRLPLSGRRFCFRERLHRQTRSPQDFCAALPEFTRVSWGTDLKRREALPTSMEASGPASPAGNGLLRAGHLRTRTWEPRVCAGCVQLAMTFQVRFVWLHRDTQRPYTVLSDPAAETPTPLPRKDAGLRFLLTRALLGPGRSELMYQMYLMITGVCN